MFAFFSPSPPKYSPVDDNEDDSESNFPLSNKELSPKPSRLRAALNYLLSWFWILSTVLFALLCTLQYFERRSIYQRGAYETGFSLELDPIKSQISLKEVQFTGGLYAENGTVKRRPQDVVWFDTPSPELDGRWNNLMRGMYDRCERRGAQGSDEERQESNLC
jgi:hypothetical protein